MTTEIDPVKFGELRGQVSSIQKTLDKHTEILEKLDTKLDGVVTYQQFAERVEKVDATLEAHDTRITTLEKRFELSDKSIWKRIAMTIEANLVKVIAGGALILVIYALFYIMQQQLSQSMTPEKVNEIITEKMEAN